MAPSVHVACHDLSKHDSVELRPLADLHWESPESLGEVFDDWLEWVQNAENRYWVGLGDYFDTVTRTSLGNPTNLRMGLDDAMEGLGKALWPVRGRCLGILPGNHEQRLTKAAYSCPARNLAGRLDVPYLRDAFFARIKVGRQGKRAARQVYTVYGVHGFGGGKLVGGKVNKVVELAGSVAADLYLLAHVHTPAVHKDRIMEATRDNCVSMRERTYVVLGSSLGWGGYAQRGNFRPSALCYPVITLSGKERRVEVTL